MNIMAKNFGAILKQLMTERGISARELSRETGIPVSTLSEWSGGREPKLGEPIIRLARYFGVSLEFLATGHEVDTDLLKEVASKLKEEFVLLHQGTYRVRIEKSQKKRKIGD